MRPSAAGLWLLAAAAAATCAAGVGGGNAAAASESAGRGDVGALGVTRGHAGDGGDGAATASRSPVSSLAPRAGVWREGAWDNSGGGGVGVGGECRVVEQSTDVQDHKFIDGEPSTKWCDVSLEACCQGCYNNPSCVAFVQQDVSGWLPCNGTSMCYLFSSFSGVASRTGRTFGSALFRCASSAPASGGRGTCAAGNSTEPGTMRSPVCADSPCYTPKAGGGAAKPASVGTVVVAVCASAVAVYCVGGAAVNARRGERGKDVVPHRAFWAEVLALIGAGCAFTFWKARSVTHMSAVDRYEAL